MRPFRCEACDQLVFFDNSVCLRCQSPLGYLSEQRRLITLRSESEVGVVRPLTENGPSGAARPGLARCANALVVGCNWLVSVDGANPEPLRCDSCRLTSVRPADDDLPAMAALAKAEAAKRRLIDQLNGLGLPIVDRMVDAEHGLTFELLSSRDRSVTTGHRDGIVTLDLSESDDAHREWVRQQLGEPYRTVLGHLRHEIAHYLWPRLVFGPAVDTFRTLFGDERIDYQSALENHYVQDPVDDGSWWPDHVSRYATMHPWEDWAETFAHYLHIRDGVETAESFGLTVEDPARAFGAATVAIDDVAGGVGPLIERWMSLSFAINALSRSMGQDDLYPFVLSPSVVAKLQFVHRLVDGRRS